MGSFLEAPTLLERKLMVQILVNWQMIHPHPTPQKATKTKHITTPPQENSNNNNNNNKTNNTNKNTKKPTANKNLKKKKTKRWLDCIIFIAYE